MSAKSREIVTQLPTPAGVVHIAIMASVSPQRQGKPTRWQLARDNLEKGTFRDVLLASKDRTGSSGVGNSSGNTKPPTVPETSQPRSDDPTIAPEAPAFSAQDAIQHATRSALHALERAIMAHSLGNQPQAANPTDAELHASQSSPQQRHSSTGEPQVSPATSSQASMVAASTPGGSLPSLTLSPRVTLNSEPSVTSLSLSQPLPAPTPPTAALTLQGGIQDAGHATPAATSAGRLDS
jgi:hypothetical protein